MKTDFRSRFWVKALALLLTVVCGAMAALGWLYTLAHYDSIFRPQDYTDSRAYNTAMNDTRSSLESMLRYYDRIRRGESLTYFEQQQYDAAKAALDVANTNFRYTVRDNKTSELLLSSAGENSLSNVGYVGSSLRSLYPTGRDYSYSQFDDEQLLTIFYDGYGNILYQVQGYADGPYTPDEVNKYALEFGCDQSFAVRDSFYAARYETTSQTDPVWFYFAVAATVLCLVGTVFLMSCAGRRKGAEGFVLNWSDKIPYDVYFCAMACAITGLAACGIEAAIEVFFYESSYQVLLLLSAGIFVLAFALGEAGLMSTAARCKAHTLLRNTVMWKLCKLIGHCFRAMGRGLATIFGRWQLTHRVVILFLLYLVGTVLTGCTIILILPYQAAVLYGLCRWTEGWQTIRDGTAAIIGGKPDTVIDTHDMDRYICRELRSHAEQLNDLGSAINSAVEERLKSERMKAELITNVSHDLKTPLTSIINYVDLLKKEDIQGEKAQEYIEVLDRKSQRLKKLTEDLVEASKASTGAIAINKERLGLAQLVNQALGEHSERFAAAELTVVPDLPAEEIYVSADGRHLWRVLDNLLGNCRKYAMAGTRIYIDLKEWEGSAVLSVKNVSAQALNIPPEQLMERFVRGDESRTTEGSGLGLSIARSLTELQGGTFRLEVDGDLFKAIVTLPVVK